MSGGRGFRFGPGIGAAMAEPVATETTNTPITTLASSGSLRTSAHRSTPCHPEPKAKDLASRSDTDC